MPASANGIYGFRPSLGCYNFTTGMGLVPAEFTRDTVGMLFFHLTQVTQMRESPQLSCLQHLRGFRVQLRISS